jgi:nitric oxide reductase activation protein
MSEACTNAKKLGITVFTIRLEQGNSEKLQACASNTGYYYNLSNASELSGTLGKIMKSIKKIRLTN